MKKTKHKKPSGTSYAKDAAIAKFYDDQSDEDVVAEIEAASANKKTVLVEVPRKLLPQVLKLIDKRKKSA
jgi:hypothetical protein